MLWGAIMPAIIRLLEVRIARYPRLRSLADSKSRKRGLRNDCQRCFDEPLRWLDFATHEMHKSDIELVIKQRMQVHGSAYRSILQCTKSVYRHEGLRAFYVSYPTTIGMTVPFTALQFSAYGSISQFINPQRDYNPQTHMIAGGLAGGFAAALTTPLDVIKTLLQTRGSAKDTELRLARGMFDAAAIIKRQHGYRGFFRGLRPRILTSVPSTAICWCV